MKSNLFDNPFEAAALSSLLWRLRSVFRGFLFWRILSVIAVTPFPVITQQIIDKGITPRNLPVSLGFAGLSLLLLCLHVFSMRRCVPRLSETSQSLLDAMRGRIFSKLQFMHFGFLDSTQTGRLLSKYAFDTQNVEAAVVPMVSSVIPELVRSVLLVIVLACLNPWVLLFFVLALPIVIIIRITFMRRLSETNEQVRLAREKLTGHASEFISAIKLVRGFGQEQPVEKNMGVISGHYAHTRRNQMIVNQTLGFVLFSIFSSIDILTVAAGAVLVIRDQMTLGVLVAMLAALPIILSPVNILTQFSIQYMQAQESYRSIKELMDSGYVESWWGRQLPSVLKAAIRLENISFKYDRSGQLTLNKLSLDIQPGEHVAFVGASGSGKSTLVNLILGLYRPTEGTIYIDGIAQEDLHIKEFRRQCAIVMQDNLLLSGSILDNLRFAQPQATLEQVIKAAKDANAWEFIERMPQGLDTRVGERGVTLSGGQRQRIAIARAILRNPVLLILDEATSALDNESEAVVQDALERAAKNRTTITIAHRLSTVRKADKIVVLREGHIVEQGTYEELAQRPDGAFAALLKAHTM